MFDSIPLITYGLAAIAAITIAFVVVRSSTSKETNRINQDNIKALQTQNGLQAGQIDLLNKSKDALKSEVTTLTIKVENLSTIPVQKIEQHMKDTNEILRSILPLINQPTTVHTTTETVKTTG
jgi:hypothetical protein